VFCKILMQISSDLQANIFSMCLVNWCNSHQIFKQFSSPCVL
jgi:hypothetical protein